MLPGMTGLDLDTAQEELPRIEAIICSMTPEERLAPDVIDGSRRKRIAAGSGSEPVEVNQLLKQFRQMKKIMSKFAGTGAGAGLSFSARGEPKLMTARRRAKLRRKRRRK